MRIYRGMAKKAQPVFVGFCIFFMVIIVLFAMIPILKDTIVGARDAQHLDCTGLVTTETGYWTTGTSAPLNMDSCISAAPVKYRYALIDQNAIWSDWATYSTPFNISTSINTAYKTQHYCTDGSQGSSANVAQSDAAMCIIVDFTFLYYLGIGIGAAGAFMWWRKGQA